MWNVWEERKWKQLLVFIDYEMISLSSAQGALQFGDEVLFTLSTINILKAWIMSFSIFVLHVSSYQISWSNSFETY